MDNNNLIEKLNRAQEKIEIIKDSLLKNEKMDCVKTLHNLKSAKDELKKFGEAYANQNLRECVNSSISKEELEKDLLMTITSSFNF